MQPIEFDVHVSEEELSDLRRHLAATRYINAPPGADWRAGMPVEYLRERERVTVTELYRFAKDQLRLDYVFWGTQEPYYSKQVIPYLRGLARTIMR